jgi:RNA-directed DNA polymerase
MKSSSFKARQLQYLASLLRCAPDEIEHLCAHIGEYYSKWVELKKDKLTGKVKTYPDGTPKQRTIRPSRDELKKIQKSITVRILGKIEMPENVHGGVKKKSNITNAKKHQGNRFKFATDLNGFFPNINHKQIYGLFLRLGYSNHIAHWLTKLTSIEFELPQGTPTSTAIANLIFLPCDHELITFCKENSITYTRFVDDLTFSAPIEFRHLTSQLIDIVKSHQFQISYRKTKYHGNQILTGIEVFNNYIDTPKNIREKAISERQSDQDSHRPYTNYLNSVRRTNKNLKFKNKLR